MEPDYINGPINYAHLQGNIVIFTNNIISNFINIIYNINKF